ncbi:rCG30633 [Rattus norvegicus]|uniref:RCG30633 n=1 Tax=Rattus norvegicus TaxID=10116 RepID=A6ISQ7_RAT|nr:rCG30633 [Rattus norvegicus]
MAGVNIPGIPGSNPRGSFLA